MRNKGIKERNTFPFRKQQAVYRDGILRWWRFNEADKYAAWSTV